MTFQQFDGQCQFGLFPRELPVPVPSHRSRFSPETGIAPAPSVKVVWHTDGGKKEHVITHATTFTIEGQTERGWHQGKVFVALNGTIAAFRREEWTLVMVGVGVTWQVPAADIERHRPQAIAFLGYLDLHPTPLYDWLRVAETFLRVSTGERVLRRGECAALVAATVTACS